MPPTRKLAIACRPLRADNGQTGSWATHNHGTRKSASRKCGRVRIGKRASIEESSPGLGFRIPVACRLPGTDPHIPISITSRLPTNRVARPFVNDLAKSVAPRGSNSGNWGGVESPTSHDLRSLDNAVLSNMAKRRVAVRNCG
jgi:hypothetical protein